MPHKTSPLDLQIVVKQLDRIRAIVGAVVLIGLLAIVGGLGSRLFVATPWPFLIAGLGLIAVASALYVGGRFAAEKRELLGGNIAAQKRDPGPVH